MNITLIEDSREQLGYSNLFHVPCIRGTISVGDYSVVGLENRIAIERKSLNDLLGSLTRGRERFEKELSRAKHYYMFFVVVEAKYSTVLKGDFERDSLADPKAIWESIAALTIRHGTPFLFADNRTTAAALTESLLLKFAREFIKTADEIRLANKRLTMAQ